MGILYCLLHKIVRIDCYVKYEEYSKHSVTFSDVDDINSDDAWTKLVEATTQLQ